MRIVEINENTRVPLRTAVAVTGMAISAAIWLTTLSIAVSDAKASLNDTQQDLVAIQRDRLEQREKLYNVMYKIDRRLSRIEGKLNIPTKDE